MVLGEFLERSGFDQQEVAERISKATWQLASGEDAARWELQGSDSLAWAS